MSLVWLLLLAMGSASITGDAITKDADNNLSYGWSLREAGVISLDVKAPYAPSMFRDPLPGVANAVMLEITDALLGPAPRAEYFSGPRAEILKHQNLLWLSLLSAAVFVILWSQTASFALALGAVLASNALLLSGEYGTYMLDSLYTESLCAALLAWASLLAARAVTRGSLLPGAGAGLLLGLATLTKAALMYVTLGFAACLPLLAVAFGRGPRAARVTTVGAVLLLAFALPVAPWMARNHAHFGQWSLASRGGEAIYTRALTNLMPADEYFGEMMQRAPWPLNGVLRRVLGYSREELSDEGTALLAIRDQIPPALAARDLEASLAGKPDETLTYYRRGRAEHNRLTLQLAARGDAAAEYTSDGLLVRAGVHEILAHPVRHLAYVPLWIWSCTFFVFPALAVGLVCALRRRDTFRVVLLLPAMGLLLFYALTCFVWVRYSNPVYALGVVAVALLVHDWWRGARRSL